MKKALFLMMCLCFSISVLAQAKTVTGTVVDAIGGLSLKTWGN